MLKQVEKILAHVKKINLLAQDALQANEKLFKDKGKESDNFKHKIIMDKIEQQLNTKYKRAAKFVKNFGIDKFIKSAQTDSSAEWSNEKLEQTGQLYYQAYIDTCSTLLLHLESTRSRILSRIEEQKTNPNIAALLEQWQQDNNVGRAKNWLTKQAIQKAALSDDLRAQFSLFEQQFNDIIANENTRHLERTKKEASLYGVRRKIITLFHQKNIAALQTLAQSLKLHTQTNQEATSLYHLCLAYFFTATKDESQALAYFEKLPDDEILEDELQQIASIAFKLENYDLAKACLKQLTSIASIYIPQYAKLLLLLGEKEVATACYTDFLQNHPDDIFMWCSLGVFYFENGASEAAKLAFEMVLSQDSEHVRAKVYMNKIQRSKK